MKVDWKTLALCFAIFFGIALLVQIPVRALLEDNLIESGRVTQADARLTFVLFSVLGVLCALFVYQVLIATRIWEPMVAATSVAFLTGTNPFGFFLVALIGLAVALGIRWIVTCLKFYTSPNSQNEKSN